ncbi:MAG: DUF6687 family protein [Acidimicrobiales bacterium]
MTLPPLRYEPYDETVGTANVVVDGSPNAGTVLTVSHWPGMPTPPGCAADTSAEMAFRYLDRGADLHDTATVVTNNHFDQDGLAGLYALVAPHHAVLRRRQLEDLAAAGDFAVYADRSSARLSMAVAALGDPSRSPVRDLPDEYADACTLLYRTALELLPGWLDDAESCQSLWGDEDAELEAGLAAVASGAVTIDEDIELDLAVVTLPPAGRSSGHRFVGRRFAGVHPMALHRATHRSTILTIDPADGRHQLVCRYEGWVQFRSRPIRPRVDLRPLADRLTATETGGAVWRATSPADLMPELQTLATGPASSLDPPDLRAAVADHLRQAPPAWDPYAVRP